MTTMIGRVIRKIIEKKKLAYRKIAADLGIDHGNLYHSLADGANPEWKTIEKVLNYLGYDFQLVERKEVKPTKSKRSAVGVFIAHKGSALQREWEARRWRQSP